jgi:serine/threonine protein kinase
VPTADKAFLDFLSYLLTPDPSQRPSAQEALAHPWLAQAYAPAEQGPD